MLKRKFSTILKNVLRQGISSIISFSLPFLVINHYSKNLWADFVGYSLYLMAAVAIVAWGGTDLIIRKISHRPNNSVVIIQELLLSRMPILLLSFGITFLLFPVAIATAIALSIAVTFVGQLFFALMRYERLYTWSSLIEVVCYVCFLVCFFSFQSFGDIKSFLRLYTFYQLLRTLLAVSILNGYVYPWYVRPSFDVSYLWKSYGLFIFSIVGFLMSRLDLYLVSYTHNKSLLANYQLFNAVFVNAMIIPYLIYSPYQKNLYRNGEIVYRKVKRLICLAGLFITPIILLVISIIFRHFAGIETTPILGVLLFFSVFPSFVYSVDILFLLKNKLENRVVFLTIIVLLVEFCSLYILLVLQQELSSALTGVAIGQITFWFLLSREVKKHQITHHQLS
ncbi:hypothetical protein ACQKCH_14890 [Nubsella zeaxanthinifaciens]|uniref:hypothetical protein n=1 Tax=Nubsella zeaxanthinifaciens TaxID=392412 RepID=UPI003CFDE99B